MPYKDPEQKRQANRENMRRQRADEKLKKLRGERGKLAGAKASEPVPTDLAIPGLPGDLLHPELLTTDLWANYKTSLGLYLTELGKALVPGCPRDGLALLSKGIELVNANLPTLQPPPEGPRQGSVSDTDAALLENLDYLRGAVDLLKHKQQLRRPE